MNKYQKELPNLTDMNIKEAINFLRDNGYSDNDYNIIYKISFNTNKNNIIKVKDNNIYVSNFKILPYILLIILIIITILTIIFINKHKKINYNLKITSVPSTWSKSVTVRIDEDNTNALNYDYCILDSDNQDKCNYQRLDGKTLTTTNTGKKYVWFRANLDNTNVISNKVTIYVDNSAPDIKILSADTTSNTIKYNINVTDNESGIKEYGYSINNSDFIMNNKDTYTFTGLKSNQTYKIDIKAIDNLGNEVTKTFYNTTKEMTTTTTRTIITTEKTTEERKIYKVTFDTNGGNTIADESVKSLDKIGTLPIPEREGYEFVGWMYNNELIDENLEVVSNIKLYATYKPITYTITYNLADGICENPSTYDITSDDITLNNPIKEGYTFTGWTSENSNEPILTYIIKSGSVGNLVLNANYQENTYKIIYHSNTDSDETKENIISYSSEYTILDNMFTYDNKYVFEEWNTLPDGTGTSYKTNDIVSKLTNIQDDTVNLYAIYKKS